jgi:lipoprotein-anchoring transpeptidase ErfK/SrfK
VTDPLIVNPSCAERGRGRRIGLGSRNFEWAVAASFTLVSLSGVPAAAFPFEEYGGGGFWGYPSYQGGYYVRERPAVRERPVREAPRTVRHRSEAANSAEPKVQPTKPSGPLIIAISIGSQHLTVYDNGTPVASAPVSTGMKGHLTPTGLFSIIQKQKWHESNLYSNAPMPFMERITWSGVALHAGVLPGYAASHGCIRLPHDFAVRLYGMTRIGARVIVSHNDISPFEIDHPHLDALTRSTSAPSAPDSDPKAPAPKTPAPDAGTPPAGPGKDGTGSIVIQGGTSNEAGGTVSPTLRQRLLTQGEGVAELRPALDTFGAKVLQAPDKPSGPAPAKVTETSAAKGGIPALSVTQGAPPAANTPTPAGSTSAEAAPANAADPALRPGPISLFVSRKEGKLFVRKGFEPVFDMPVTIARSGSPIGTHVFTAARAPEGASGLRWLAVSLSNDRDDEPKSARGKSRGAREEAAVDVPRLSARDALDRIELPPEALDRIAPLMTPGASLVIADQGLGPETGKETDFVVLTR